MDTVNRWNQQYQKTGEINDIPPRRRFKKLAPEKLKAYIQKHPDAYLSEIAEEFGCSVTAVGKALKKLGITRKKRLSDTGSRSLNK